MKRIGLILIVLLFTTSGAWAETQLNRSMHPHDLRIGVGDMLFETLIWHNGQHPNYSGAEPGTYQERQRCRWTPHLMVGYTYRVNRWLGVGLQADFQHTAWEDRYYNNTNVLVDKQQQYFYNLSILPTVRFTYLHAKHVSLYSSISIGLNINGGSETNVRGQNTVCAVGIDAAVLGMNIGKERWFGFVEVGGLSSLRGQNEIFLLMSRIVTAGVGVWL